MRTRRLCALLAALSIPLLAGGAFAVANSVSTTPGSQVILASRTSANSPVSARSDRHGTSTSTATKPPDDPAGHDANDAHDADVNDDHGHDATVPTTVTTAPGDDGPGHDAGDDHGHDGTTTTSAPDDHRGPGDGNGTTTTTTTDDHRGPGGGHGGGSGHDG